MMTSIKDKGGRYRTHGYVFVNLSRCSVSMAIDFLISLADYKAAAMITVRFCQVRKFSHSEMNGIAVHCIYICEQPIVVQYNSVIDGDLHPLSINMLMQQTGDF